MIKIARSMVERIFEQSKGETPNEACGYLAGSGDTVKDVLPMTNADQSPEHFSFDPEEQFAAMEKTRNLGMELVGVYHSHPSTPARPSVEDIKLAYDSEMIYVILSLAGPGRDIRAFRINRREKKFTSVEIEITEDGQL